MADIAIAGGGASGVLLAAQILRESSDARVILFEPGELGLGVAYATTCPTHQLNVPAAKMSGFADDPMHFLRWLERHYTSVYSGTSFAPRRVFGEYLRSIATETAATYDGRFEHRREMLENRSSGADIVVLATGNTAPAAWPDAPLSERFFTSAWGDGALVPGSPDERVLILGTGLTAVDAVLGLRYHGHRGPIYLVSRRGLLPHEHRILDAPLSTTDWRATVDGMRPLTNDLWQAFTFAERRRFLHHLVPYWNVHRHRMAPESATTIAELLASGTIATIAGRTSRFEQLPEAIRVRIRERGSDAERSIDAERVISCSGPEHNVTKLKNPLIRSLLAEGALAPSALGIGINVAANGALIDVNGVPSKNTFAIGPVRFGTLIETTAIPEIRDQAKHLARAITRLRPVV